MTGMYLNGATIGMPRIIITTAQVLIRKDHQREIIMVSSWWRQCKLSQLLVK